MPAGNLNSYPVIMVCGRNYVDMTDKGNPVTVWTPAGYRQAPNIVAAEKMPSNVTMPNDIAAIRRSLTPKAGRLSSGEWYQIMKRFKATNPEVEENMITGNYEATATLTDFTHGRKVENHGVSYFDGLLLQHPETDGEILLTDENGIIKAKDAWQMPLPLNGGFVKELLQKKPRPRQIFRHDIRNGKRRKAIA